MNIVVLGAGTVGSSVAEVLCANHQNVCVLDTCSSALSEVEERLDVQTILGSACDAVKLFQAGVQSSGLCLAVTGHDEANLVGASMARSMGAGRCVARIFNPSYRDHSTFDYQRHFGIDRLLSLEHLTAVELAKHIRSSSAVAVESFARGGVDVVGIEVGAKARCVGQSLRDLALPRSVRVGLLSNQSRTIIPGADDVIHGGDQVTIIGQHESLESVKPLFEHRAPPRLSVVIAGGGETGYNLALLLQRMRCNIVLMEAQPERCSYLADRLDRVTVLHADSTRRSDMEEARVGKADVFVAATGHDEDNIVCGVEARELGSRRILTVVRRPDYANVLEKLGIDLAVSPREAMARQVFGMVTSGPVRERSLIAAGEAEVWEVEIRAGTPITAAPLRELAFPQTLIAAFEREGYIRVPSADDQLQEGDIAVVLVHAENAADAR